MVFLNGMNKINLTNHSTNKHAGKAGGQGVQISLEKFLTVSTRRLGIRMHYISNH